jgi:hypothetical protein
MGDDDEKDQKLQAPPDFDGPTRHRRCTDVLCLGLIILMWVLMTALGSYAVSHGDYRLILYPLDYAGNVCGTDYGSGNMTDFPSLYHVNNFGGGVCVKNCPSLANHTSDGLTDTRTLITYAGVWQTSGAELPTNFVQVGNYSNSSDAVSCTDSLCYPNNSTPASWLSPGVAAGFGVAFYVGDSYDIFSRCFLSPEAENRIFDLVDFNITVTPNSTSANVFKTGERFWTNLYGDLYTSRQFILGFGFGVAFFVSLIYTYLLRFPFLLSSVVWGSIFMTLVLFYALGIFAYKKADHFEHESPRTVSEREIRGFRGFAYIMWIVGIFLTLLACCLRNQIQLAIGCVKEAAKAVESMILIFLVPVLQAIGLLIFMGVFLIYAVYLASLGKIKTEYYPLIYDDPASPTIAVRTYTYNRFSFESAWFLIFCLYWTGNFIVAVGDVIIAMSVAKWYFTRNKLLVTSVTVVGSVVDTCLYHLGTCAYGSLILAIVQWLRTFLAYIQNKISKLHNLPANIVLCCCQVRQKRISHIIFCIVLSSCWNLISSRTSVAFGALRSASNL